MYRLTPKKESIGTLKKYVLGERNANKTNKTLLLLGETGAGKSTLINVLVNYAIGVTWEENIYFEIVDDDIKNQSVSQTNDVIVYQIFGFEDKTLPYSLTIIDTPGYGSTKGAEEDTIISQRLVDLFCSQDGIHEINVVGLVMKSTECRLTDRLSYILNSVMSLFGKDMENNVVVLMTYSHGIQPQNALNALKEANIKYATCEKNQPVNFLFNNCWSESRSEGVELLEVYDKMSRNGLRGFTEFLRKTPPRNLEKTLEVINERIRLTACISSLQDKVRFLELKAIDRQQIQEGLRKHEEDMEKNKNFEVTVDEPYKEKEPIQGWPFFRSATCCSVCEENCHFPGCTLAISVSWCKVMVNGRCTVCTKKCEVLSHVRETSRYVIKTRKCKQTLTNVKKKYQESKKGKENKSSLLGCLQKEIESLDNDKTKLLEEAFQHVRHLEKIALNVDSLSTFVCLDFLIEKLKEKNDQEKVMELTRMKERMSQNDKAGAFPVFRKICYKLWPKTQTGSSSQ